MCCTSLRNGAPAEVYLFQTPSQSESGFRTYAAYATDTWRLNDRLTFNLGLRFDRYRLFLPAQRIRAGRFNPATQVFPAVDNVIDWNARTRGSGLIARLSGDGRTLAKVHYGLYRYPPGTELGFSTRTPTRTSGGGATRGPTSTAAASGIPERKAGCWGAVAASRSNRSTRASNSRS